MFKCQSQRRKSCWRGLPNWRSRPEKKSGRLEFRAAERPTVKASTSLFLESYRKKSPLYAGLPGTATRDMTSGMTGILPEEVAAGEISS
jgi:hypothetical protein